MADQVLPAAFYARETTVVARELLGKVIERRRGDSLIRARIVEVEAYLGEDDAASHARSGPTKRAAIMFGPSGRLYVYLIYGLHHCMNFVANTGETAGAILIRSAALLDPGADPRAIAEEARPIIEKALAYAPYDSSVWLLAASLASRFNWPNWDAASALEPCSGERTGSKVSIWSPVSRGRSVDE